MMPDIGDNIEFDWLFVLNIYITNSRNENNLIQITIILLKNNLLYNIFIFRQNNKKNIWQNDIRRVSSLKNLLSN